MTLYVTVSFPGIVPTFREGVEFHPYETLGANFFEAVRIAMNQWQSVADVVFLEEPGTDGVFPYSNDSDTRIFAGTVDGVGGIVARAHTNGDITFDAADAHTWINLEAMAAVFAHEFGHVLGDSHHTDRPDDLMYKYLSPSDAPKFLSPVEIQEWQLELGAPVPLAVKASGIEGQMQGLYRAAFDRDPDADGFIGWHNAITEGGSTVQGVAKMFVASQEFHNTHADKDKGQFVAAVYENTLDRLPDAGEVAAWIALMDDGMTKDEVLLGFALSDEARQTILDDGLWYM